jgi:hypothetical protein
MPWLEDSGHRIGLYWLLAAVIFGWFCWMALRRMKQEPNRPRVSIIAFTGSWCVLMADLALARYGAFGTTPAEKAHHVMTAPSELERVAAVGSLLWMVIEFRTGAIRTVRRGADGPLQPSVEERAVDAAERTASATEAIADQGLQIKTIRERTETA